MASLVMLSGCSTRELRHSDPIPVGASARIHLSEGAEPAALSSPERLQLLTEVQSIEGLIADSSPDSVRVQQASLFGAGGLLIADDADVMIDRSQIAEVIILTKESQGVTIAALTGFALLVWYFVVRPGIGS